MNITFWGAVRVTDRKIKSIVVEMVYPADTVHNYSLDEFSISASDTYPKLKAYIEKCVNSGMGHHNTYIQVRKFARETLVPQIEREIRKKIGLTDTRFYPTRRTVYTYWMQYSGGSVKASEDQQKIKELLNDCAKESAGQEPYFNYEPFDPRLLAQCYGLSLDQTFEELLLNDENREADFIFSDENSQAVPVLPYEFFENVEEHLCPRKGASAQQRYDQYHIAVKVLIRNCSRQTVRARACIKPGQPQPTGAFYLFLQTKEMTDFYTLFGHESILFMDSGFRVNRNANPITFIIVLDNFTRGRMVGVLISQFTDEHTYSKCLSEFLRGNISRIKPNCTMTDFDLSENCSI